MVKILDRYIFTQLIGPFCLGFFMFVTVIAIDPLIAALQNIVNDGIPVLVVVKWFLCRLPQDMIFTFPMSMLLSTLLVFGRMSKDSETIAMKAGGINFFRLLVPVFAFAFVVTIISFIFNEMVVPYSNQKANQIRRQQILRLVEPEATENSLMKSSDGAFVYARKVFESAGKMERVLLEYYKDGVLDKRISAVGATYNHGWTLENVVEQIYHEGKVATSVNYFQMKLPYLKETPSDFAKKSKKPSEMSFKELQARIEMYERTRFDDPTDLKVELALKTSLPFATMFFALIGASFGLTSYRSGAFIGFGVSVIIIFIYYVIMSLSVAMGKAGLLPVVLSAWLQNLIFLAVGLVLVVRVNT